MTSTEQGPRQGPRYSKEVAIIAKIYTDNKLFIACQGVPACGITVSNPREDLSQLINKLQPSIAAREKEHPSQRVYTTFFTDHRYHNQDQAPSYQQPPQESPQQPRSANSIFNQQQQSPIPPQTFNKLQKIQYRGEFQDSCGSQDSYRGGYQHNLDRKFSWRVP